MVGHIPFAYLCLVWLEKVHYLFMWASCLFWVQLPDRRTNRGWAVFCSGPCNPERWHTRSGTVLCTPGAHGARSHYSLESCSELLSSSCAAIQHHQPLPRVVKQGTGQLKSEVSSPNSGVIKDNPAFQRNLRLEHCHLVTLERSGLWIYWFSLPPHFPVFDYDGEHPQQMVYALWSG